jgi:hypothetical protein
MFSLPVRSPSAIIGLRFLFTLSQKEDAVCTVLRWQEGDVLFPDWLSDFTDAPFVRPCVAQGAGVAVPNSGLFEITSASFRWDIQHTSVGGSAVF